MLSTKNEAYNVLSILVIITVMVSIPWTFDVMATPVTVWKTATLYPIADAFVNSESSDTNYGGDEYLLVSSNSKFNYTYVMFDLSSIPSDANITSAELSLYLASTGGKIYGRPEDKIGAYYCSDTSWTELGITWNNKPSFDPTPTDTWSFTLIYTYKVYKSWNVIDDVKASVTSGRLTEVLKFERKTGYGYACFESREGTHKPMLRLEYSVELEPSTITCSPSPSSIVFGSSVTVSGSISPAPKWRPSPVKVTLNYTRPDGSIVTRIITTIPTGDYSDVYTPDSVGSWSVYASWSGDEDYAGSTSPKAPFGVTKEPSEISCLVPLKEIEIGETIALSGSISPAHAWVTVTLTFTKPDGSTSIRTATSWPDGSFRDAFEPNMVGVWHITSSWEGDDDTEAALSPTVSFTVIKPSSSISCSPSKTIVTKGEGIKVSGSIIPPRGEVTVTLTYTAPDGTILTRTVATTEVGTYGDTYAPEKVGLWSVKASWAGDEEYAGGESPLASFTVEEEKRWPCIIATATYGSELTPEVQSLRSFRDQKILSTFAGSQFMNVFNSWYYSFSPDVARFIADKPAVRNVVKAVLYPLMGILHLSSATYAMFGFNEELGVVMAGLVASSLIGIVYFSPLITILLIAMKYCKKSLPNLGKLKPLSMLWLVSLGLIYIGEITATPIIMMVATGAFVIFTVTLLAATIALKAVQRRL